MTRSGKAAAITPADVEAARFDGAHGELSALRTSLQFQRDRTTSTVRRAILLEIIREIDARIVELRSGEL